MQFASLQLDKKSGLIDYVDLVTGHKMKDGYKFVSCEHVLGLAWRGFLGFIDAVSPLLREIVYCKNYPEPPYYWHWESLGIHLAM